MSTSAVSGSTPSADPPARAEGATVALAKAFRRQREEAAALVRLVEQATATGDKGRHVNYFA
jgi:hypothetical protein